MRRFKRVVIHLTEDNEIDFVTVPKGVLVELIRKLPVTETNTLWSSGQWSVKPRPYDWTLRRHLDTAPNGDGK